MATLVGALVGALVAVGCSSSDDDAGNDDAGNDDATADPATIEPSGELVVFAASSLTESIGELAEAFEDRHPAVTVVASFAGSSTLATQILEGAPADVFAAADERSIERLTSAGAVDGASRVMALNRPAIVVAEGNPLGISGLDDLTDPDLVVVLCAPDVPCGGYAEQVLDRARLAMQPDSLEPSVRSVVTKVALGEADAGIAYATDVVAADDLVDGVAIDERANVTASYPIVVSAEAPNPPAAAAFVELALGETGREILARHGFSLP